MGKGSIGKLPVLGEITLPVHLMVYDDKDNPQKHFHSNFAFWHAADGASDVSTDEGNIGSIGGMMGGHVEMSRYYPCLDRSKEHTKEGSYRQWINVIIDVQDMWNQIETLLDTPGTKVIINGLEEIHEKYQALKKAEREAEDIRKEKLEAIRQMQREAEEEEEKKSAISGLIGGLAEAKKKKDKFEEENKIKYWIKDTGVIEDGGWDLDSCIDTSDFNYKEDDEDLFPRKIIPKNYGTGIKIADKNGTIWVTDKKENPEVTLTITSWVGTSPGAIHYYGNLRFSSDWPHDVSNINHRTSCPDIPFFRGNKISLTHELEAWEFRDHPDSYKGWHPGDHYAGFYTKEDAVQVARHFFNKYFEKGWKLKIED
jgi:hypothetical protein